MKGEPIPEFGIKRENEERRDGGCGVIFDPLTQKYAVGEKANGLYILFGGGVEANEDIQTGVVREVVEESGLTDFLHIEKIAEAFTHYRNAAKEVNRVAHATCFLIILKSAQTQPAALEEHEKFVLTWVTADQLLQNWRSRSEGKNYDHWIYFFEKAVRRAVALGYDKTSVSSRKKVDGQV